jgi:magnesium transporter
MISSADILDSNILIVDDQLIDVTLLERMLSGAGYINISSTTDPCAAAELHRKNHYDLILLDMQMPMMDGFQVMEALKKIDPDSYLPVLVITAQPNHKLRALKIGAKDFISKPYSLAEVLARVHNMLEVRLLHEEAKNHNLLLEQKVQEVEASRDLIRRQSDEVKQLYHQLVTEQKQSFELAAQAGVMVGVEKEERIATHWFRSFRLRHPWLQFNLLTSLVGGGMVLLFQETISRLLILTVFVPILISQASNTGSQVLAITLRGLNLGELNASKQKALVLKEAFLGLLNGILVGLVAAIAMYAAATFQHSSIALMLSVVVFLAMASSCLISGMCGAIVPLALKKFGADPATASSIVLTTATDAASMVMLLGLAAILVR